MAYSQCIYFTLEFLLPTNYPRESVTSFCSPHLPTWVGSTHGLWVCGFKKDTSKLSDIIDNITVHTSVTPTRSQWVPEITHHCQKTPFLLVGTQIDLRDDAATNEKLAKNKQRPISLEYGEKLARELRAVKYVECSALTQVSRSRGRSRSRTKNLS